MNSRHRSTGDRLFRIVIDTNVLISGLLSATGSPRRMIDGWLAGEFTLLISDDMLEECDRILGYPKLGQNLKLPSIPSGEVMDMLRTEGERVEITWLDLSGVLRDPFNGMVLDCAVSGGAHYLVSRTEDLPVIAEYEGLKVISPSGLVEVLEGQHMESRGTSPLPT